MLVVGTFSETVIDLMVTENSVLVGRRYVEEVLEDGVDQFSHLIGESIVLVHNKVLSKVSCCNQIGNCIFDWLAQVTQIAILFSIFGISFEYRNSKQFHETI